MATLYTCQVNFDYNWIHISVRHSCPEAKSTDVVCETAGFYGQPRHGHFHTHRPRRRHQARLGAVEETKDASPDIADHQTVEDSFI